MGERTVAALQELDAITRRLRRDCPWDRDQDERSIVPHTVEEAEEVADAARKGDDEGLTEEVGDLLFQVVFLCLLLEERGVADLGTVSEKLTAKLIRRHPHVFGDEQASTAEEAKAIWKRMKQAE
jgi:NTP pyrophosphatase (non-canonical NTP hydrolase)